MSDKNLVQALRAVLNREITPRELEAAPRQHPLRTPQCPPLTRFTPGTQWTAEEQAHMADCAYCRRLLERVKEMTACETRRYKLLGADGHVCESEQPGTLGGNRRTRIYGCLKPPCAPARLALAQGTYAEYRVFFADEAAAIAAGYRPCARCLPERYRQWKQGGIPGTADYPWLVVPPSNERVSVSDQGSE